MVLYTVYADCDPITAGQVKKKDQVIRMSSYQEMMVMMVMIRMKMIKVIRLRLMEMMMMMMLTLRCWQNSQLQLSINKKLLEILR